MVSIDFPARSYAVDHGSARSSVSAPLTMVLLLMLEKEHFCPPHLRFICF